MLKKLLTLDDLITFCEHNNMFSFSSESFGSQIAVQVPAMFEASDDNVDDSLLDIKVKVCHIGKNRNNSFISKENMKRAMPTLKYKAILASFVQDKNNEWDFGSHDMEICKDENGNDVINYIEQPVGCFTAEEPYLEYDEKLKRTYVIAKGKIFKEYTKAADIILTKGGTKVSCELLINKFEYNRKEKCLELIDFVFSGCTLLGEAITEGMEGSRLEIEDFSVSKNSLFNVNDELIKAIQGLQSTLDDCTKKIYERGGCEPMKKKDKTTCEEELEIISTEEFEDNSSDSDATDATDSNEADAGVDSDMSQVDSDLGEGEEDGDASEEEAEESEESDEAEVEEDEDEEEVVEDIPVEDEEEEEEPEEEPEQEETTVTEIPSSDELKKKIFSTDENGNAVLSFEISHEDIKCSLYELIYNAYEDMECYYLITSVYDDYFVMEEAFSDKVYGHKYKRTEDSVELEGEPYELFKEILTVEEKEAIDEMRARLVELETELAEYKEKDECKKKCELVESLEYAQISETSEYKEVIENMNNYSSTELREKLDGILLNHVKRNSLSVNTEKKSKSYFMANNHAPQSKNSFLDGLRK